jgi:hypothetical protein
MKIIEKFLSVLGLEAKPKVVGSRWAAESNASKLT